MNMWGGTAVPPSPPWQRNQLQEMKRTILITQPAETKARTPASFVALKIISVGVQQKFSNHD